MIGIYKITNKINNKAYIGQSIDIERRWDEHLWMLRNNKHHSSKLQYAWNDFGSESFAFEVIEEIEDRLTLDAKEMMYIKEYNSLTKGYNMVGVGGFSEYTTQKKLTKMKKEAMRNEQYDILMSIISLFDGNLSFAGNTYRQRILSKHYQYQHYMVINRLLKIVYLNYYSDGDEIVCNILFKSNRIINKTRGLTITYKDQYNVYIFNEPTLRYDLAQVFKIKDIV